MSVVARPSGVLEQEAELQRRVGLHGDEATHVRRRHAEVAERETQRAGDVDLAVITLPVWTGRETLLPIQP